MGPIPSFAVDENSPLFNRVVSTGGELDDRHWHDFGQRLLRRVPEGVNVPKLEVSAGDWRPEPLRCARNARIWVEHNPGWERVRGYTLLEYPDLPFVIFSVHNVVRDPAGALFDITPDWAPEEIFIPHEGADELHDHILSTSGAVTVALASSFDEAKVIVEVAARLFFWQGKARDLRASLERKWADATNSARGRKSVERICPAELSEESQTFNRLPIEGGA